MKVIYLESTNHLKILVSHSEKTENSRASKVQCNHNVKYILTKFLITYILMGYNLAVI